MGKTTVRGASRPSMKVEAWTLDRIKPYAGNPRKISETAVEKVAASLKKYGWRQPIVVCAAGEIVVGHTRKRAAELILERGESIPNWPDLAKAPVHPSGMDETEARAYRLADNRTGEEAEWDLDLLQFEFDALAEVDFELELTGFEASDWLKDEGGSTEPPETRLADDFGIAPFTTFNARSGWWQNRKRAWIDLGIQSELGRNDTFAAMGRLYEKAEGTEAGAWASTSIFDPVLCELLYRWLSAEGGLVLDPFAGGSVRGIVASRLGRRYVGVELRREQVEANRAQAHLFGAEPAEWIEGDSRDIPTLAGDVQADLVFSCPPYADLEVYSDDPRDLSAMDYEAFLAAYADIIAKSCAQLKEDRFACFVVGEVRDKKGRYRGFVPATIAAFEAAGLKFYNEAVLLTQVGTLAMRVRKQFEGSRKLGRAHQNVLIFVKGCPKKAAQAAGKCQFGDDALDQSE